MAEPYVSEPSAQWHAERIAKTLATKCFVPILSQHVRQPAALLCPNQGRLRKETELVSRPSAGRISSIFTTSLALYSITACWLYAEMPCSTAIAVATASLHADARSQCTQRPCKVSKRDR